MNFSNLVELYEKTYSIYDFANDAILLIDVNNERQIFELIKQDDRNNNVITFVLLIILYYREELKSGVTYNQIMKRLEKLDRQFFMECYFC